MKTSLMMATLLVCSLSAPQLFGAEPKVKTLSPAQDATRQTVLVGRNAADNMLVTLEFEAAESMWMQMGKPPSWIEHPVAKGELFHIEVKPVDSGSRTRIPYADVKFSAVNHDNKKKITGTLHPMWGDSGLHYAFNSPLAGDGAYMAHRHGGRANLWTQVEKQGPVDKAGEHPISLQAGGWKTGVSDRASARTEVGILETQATQRLGKPAVHALGNAMRAL